MKFLSNVCIYYYVQNGGKYDFIVESEAALPVDQEFWDFLLSSSKDSWNLLVYEQDWLDVEVVKLEALRVRFFIFKILHLVNTSSFPKILLKTTSTSTHTLQY